MTRIETLPPATPGMRVAGWLGLFSLLAGQVGNSPLLYPRIWQTPWKDAPWVVLTVLGTAFFVVAVLTCTEWTVSAGWPRWVFGLAVAAAISFIALQASVLMDSTRGVFPVTGPPLLGVVLRLSWVARYVTFILWVGLYALLAAAMFKTPSRKRLWGWVLASLAVVNLGQVGLWLAEPARRDVMDHWQFDGLLKVLSLLAAMGGVAFLSFLLGWRGKAESAQAPTGTRLLADPSNLLLFGSWSLWASYSLAAFLPRASMGALLLAAWGGGVWIVGWLFLLGLQGGSAFLAWRFLVRRRRIVSGQPGGSRIWGNRVLEAVSLLLVLVIPMAIVLNILARFVPFAQHLLQFWACGRWS